MVTVGLLMRLEVRPGKEADLVHFLERELEMVRDEPATTAWFAIRLGPTTFGVFDVFPDENGRRAHFAARAAAALRARASELLAQPPDIEMLDVLAAKVPS